MLLDGLEDAYERGRSMGDFGEATAERYQFTRADQDAFAIETLTRARAAIGEGRFKSEIAPITIADKAGERVISDDENPLKVSRRRYRSSNPRSVATGRSRPQARPRTPTARRRWC